MPNVFVEPRPKGKPEGAPVEHYVLELAGGERLSPATYGTQKEAIAAARQLGHEPLIARVRSTDKGKPDQWRAAD
ncbi:MAG: DUF2188 domain-containing protein [Pseudomonadota bacterium]|nr:DUF2188 domain-containing protein [Pseudomonadota bacterium]